MRTALAAAALEVYNDVQLMREMHWTYNELMSTPEDVVWAAMQVLSLEGAKHEDDMRRAERGGSSRGRYRGSQELPPVPPAPH